MDESNSNSSNDRQFRHLCDNINKLDAAYVKNDELTDSSFDQKLEEALDYSVAMLKKPSSVLGQGDSREARKLKPPLEDVATYTPIFNENATCAKCLAEGKASTEFCKGKKFFRNKCEFKRKGEHLHRKCERCGHSWLELCAVGGGSPLSKQIMNDLTMIVRLLEPRTDEEDNSYLHQRIAEAQDMVRVVSGYINLL